MSEKSRFCVILVVILGMMLLFSPLSLQPMIDHGSDELDSNVPMIDEDIKIPEKRETRAGSPRTVLAELFTQWNCGPCAWANPALNQLMDVYDSTQVVMISTHTWWPAPDNDPYYNYNKPDSNARISYYGISGVPKLLVDGPPQLNHQGSSSYDYFKTIIDNELLVLSPMTITLEGDMTASFGSVTANIEITDNLPGGGNLKIKFAVVEDNNYGMGNNGEPHHRYAMRKMLTEESLANLPIGSTYTVSRTFALDPIWNYDSVSIVVYVQNENGQDVLQAASYDFIPQKILVVDDDQSNNPYGNEDDYVELLSFMGYAFDGWVHNERGTPSSSVLGNYEAVIWLTGATSSDTLNAADQTAIEEYLDNSRGSLFLNGEDVGFDIDNTVFFWNYLHAFYINDNTTDTDITGMSSDPISDPYYLVNLPITGGSPSVINAMGGSEVFRYSPSGQTAGIKADHDLDSKVVYFAFLYFEGSDTLPNKKDIMERVLKWMVVGVDYIEIEDTEGDSGNIVTNLVLDVGNSKTLWAGAYNNTLGFLGNYPITTWKETSGGSLVSITNPGNSTTITAGLSGGSSTLTVDYFGVRNTTTITVNPPEPDYLEITDSSNGTQISDMTLLAKEQVTMYASAYNNTAGYLGLASVEWTDSAGLGTFDNPTGTSTTFTSGLVGGVTTITGDLVAKGVSDGFEITVIDAVVDYIEIRDAPSDGGSAVTEVILNVGDSMQFWAAAYNDSAGYLGDYDIAIWSENSGGYLIAISGSGETITITAQLVGGSTFLNCDVSGVLDSLQVTVNPPTIDYVQINYESGPFGTKVVNPTMPVGTQITFYGSAYNLTALYLEPVPFGATWTSSNENIVTVTSPWTSSIITVSNTNYGTVTITLNDGSGHIYQTTITVTQPTVDYIRIRDASNGQGKILSNEEFDVSDISIFYSAGYNVTAGYLGDFPVSWETTDEHVGNITGIGASTTLSALDIGSVEITADYMGSIQETISVIIKDKTNPSADAGSGGTITEGETFSFDASKSSDNGRIVDYLWDFGDDTFQNSSDPGMSHKFDHPGIYSITLTITDAGGNKDTDYITVTVLDITPPVAVANLPESPDEDIPAYFDGGDSHDNVGIVEYIWDFGDGEQLIGPYGNTTHIYEMSGTYNVTLTVKDAIGHEDSVSADITVTDTTPPQTPKGLGVKPWSDGSTLEITWKGVPDADLDHYELFVSVNGEDFTKLKDIDKAATKFVHTGCSMGNSYRYYLVAFDTSDNPSFDSPIVEGYCDIDTDSDGIFDLQDDDDDNDGLSDYREVEEATDPKNDDTDGDRHVDGEDAFPLDRKEWKDTDFDGVGDSEDAFPKDATEWKDSDGDGIGDSDDFIPIPDLLFYIIIMVVVAAVLVAVDKMVQKRHQRKYIERQQAKMAAEQGIPEKEPETGQ